MNSNRYSRGRFSFLNQGGHYSEIVLSILGNYSQSHFFRGFIFVSFFLVCLFFSFLEFFTFSTFLHIVSSNYKKISLYKPVYINLFLIKRLFTGLILFDSFLEPNLSHAFILAFPLKINLALQLGFNVTNVKNSRFVFGNSKTYI